MNSKKSFWPSDRGTLKEFLEYLFCSYLVDTTQEIMICGVFNVSAQLKLGCLKLNSQIEFVHNLEPIKFYLKCVQSSDSIWTRIIQNYYSPNGSF